MTTVRLSKTAQADIKAILRYSLRNFGEPTKLKYNALILQAINDIRHNPKQFGIQPVAKLDGYYRYHLKMSRANVSGQHIQNPSHFIVFRWLDDDILEITRLLHERMLTERHIP